MRLANFSPRISSSTCYRKEPSDLLTSMAGIISVFLQLVHFMPDLSFWGEVFSKKNQQQVGQNQATTAKLAMESVCRQTDCKHSTCSWSFDKL